MPQERISYTRGQEAFIRGWPAMRNPYPSGTPDREVWFRGWIQERNDVIDVRTMARKGHSA